MGSWLSYAAAFACALIVMLLGAREGLAYVMTQVGTGLPDLVLLAVLGPTIASVLAFALIHRVVSDASLTLPQGLITTAFVLGMALVAMLAVAIEILPGPASLVAPVVVAFFGGRYLMQRVSHA